MIINCIGGPHDGRLMDVPDDSVMLEFLDGARYTVDVAASCATFAPTTC